jgi:sepiapterin reductase
MWQYIIITGASRGFGKAMALRFAKILRTPLHFSLTGRSIADLENTRTEILSLREGRETKCDLVAVDLGDLSQLTSSAAAIFKPYDELVTLGSYSRILFISNAGSLGPLCYIGTGDTTNLALVANAVNLNLTSSCFLTSEVMRQYKGKAELTLVNISSLCAVQAFDSWGVYCAGKAARDMFYKVLAAENKSADVRVLNYAPGPLDTDMQNEIRESPTAHRETQEYFKDLKSKGQLVTCEESAAKCSAVIFQDEFESGDHIDFFDVKIGTSNSIHTCALSCLSS